MAKILFATKWVRPDKCTEVSFLAARVRESDNDDWDKLVHIMKYISGTSNLPLILSANGSGILKFWIDGSITVYPKMIGRTGCVISMERVFTIFSSTRHNLSTRSSDETDIIAVGDCISDVLWNRYWLGARGYDVFYLKNISKKFKCYCFPLFFWKRTSRFQAASARIT